MEIKPTRRTPVEIQRDIRAIHDNASLNFVPLNVRAALAFQVEFNEAVAEGIERLAAVMVAAGLTTAEVLAAAGVTRASEEGDSSNQPNG
jgi:hypothetical protein